jgi:hypothetical protein
MYTQKKGKLYRVVMFQSLYIGLGEESSIDFGRRDDPFEPCDCFMVFFRVSLA